MSLTSINSDQLKFFAKKYIWWKSPDEAVEQPERVISQVMDIGDYDDTQSLIALVGNETLKDVLAHAQAGWFRPRSWHYWHYRLGLSTLGTVPELPKRRFA